MVPGIWVFKGVLQCGFFMFFFVFCKVAAKCPENKKKSQRNHWKINGKSASHLRKPMDFKGKVQNKFKSRQKVCKKCEQTAICQNIASGGGEVPTPRIRSARGDAFFHTFCKLSVYFWTCFELSLWNPLVFSGLGWFSFDFSMISLAFLLIVWSLCRVFAQKRPVPKATCWCSRYRAEVDTKRTI